MRAPSNQSAKPALEGGWNIASSGHHLAWLWRPISLALSRGGLGEHVPIKQKEAKENIGKGKREGEERMREARKKKEQESRTQLSITLHWI